MNLVAASFRVLAAGLRLALFGGWLFSMADASSAEPADTLRERALQAYRAGRTAEALRRMNEAIADAPPSAGDLLFRARLREAEGLFAEALSDCDQALALDPDRPEAYQARGVIHFKRAEVVDAVRDFDRFLELRPSQRPYHWQRGIALYYAGRYEDGRRQFELHQTVNPNDVENAVWHFLCVARSKSLDEARKSLIPITGDSRVPMAEIHELFAGSLEPEDVLRAAKAGAPSDSALRQRLFYAHLYLALYFDALGQSEREQAHLAEATGSQATDHYMGDVARVHRKLLEQRQTLERPSSPAAESGSPR